ncbi:acetyl/propionyl/methylcrotonyl-CoA carboxylase subunit alpha [Rhizorhapis suberifaciens]|uniref:3-methylcrotonyl-CoA carboxylase alpha subunit n=1 Tax=Rhizorhapis suberifaciens TaxID=13656 RepID=A0A840HXM5_9SPHN|nr:acetyl/propionyl/methylcrotonyl-CoA carboxylase subunit alpha [Rhizorhapis suberifaciens]MBB4642845.1 3-methylcrotonyl-CoA carboxylase alpha subunit [Rhizorhapis suberifaciens]
MIQSLLIANRGEIACRIIRTARKLGIRTVAVYSDADANALHVRQADEAVHIGPAPVRESYLVGEKIIAAALSTGAQAIHPGYGFLSENAEFAQAVLDAGLVWVGPNPSSITAMGLKDAAKKLMQDAGVPTTPGYLGEDQTPARLKSEADAIGYPVLIKAVAGGGGKGMRKVDAAADFADALLSCQREAASSFGNEQVLLEKWVTNPRHIEVQVFSDSHGNVVHLFERDCSLQRRHQKVIEEAPAPGMDEETRDAICQAAVRAAKAVDYVGAGTIEFIADGSEGLRADRIWFMEMNTRLQVEHPVTEEITGQDLVEWQLRVASGEPLPKAQNELSINGWAMEARLYAEDPAKGFLPSIGRLDRFDIGSSYRTDTGVEQGGQISPFYDPMIAKLIAWAPDRDAARLSLAHTLEQTVIWPVKTNAGFLVKALHHPAFAQAQLDTGLIGREGDALLPAAEPSRGALNEAAAKLAAPGPLGGFRLNAERRLEGWFLRDGVPVAAAVPPSDRVDTATGVIVAEAGQSWQLLPWRAGGAGSGEASDGTIRSPMPGRIIAVAVAAGDKVAKGQKLLTLEAMKMEHSLVAPYDGTVAELNGAEGEQVNEGALLVKIEQGKGA